MKKNYQTAKRNSTIRKERSTIRHPLQPYPIAIWPVHRTKIPSINVNSSKRSVKKSSRNRSTSRNIQPSPPSSPPTTTTTPINCTNSPNCTARTVRKCQSHPDASGARIKNAVRYTAWSTKNSGVRSAGGRRRASVSAIETTIHAQKLKSSQSQFFLFWEKKLHINQSNRRDVFVPYRQRHLAVVFSHSRRCHHRRVFQRAI